MLEEKIRKEKIVSVLKNSFWLVKKVNPNS